MNTTLVVMAAGIASRYGGSKQTTGMGPHGEILMEYSVHDAIRAGFNRVVFVIRPEHLKTVRQLCGDRFADRIEVCYAFQDYSSLPDWYSVPEGRTKPFGTVHAVLCAQPYIDGAFAVLNADDYYGVDSFQTMHAFLEELRDDRAAAMMGYRLQNTVSAFGDVTRGICQVEEGRLAGVEEVKKIHLCPDGRIVDLSKGEPGRELDPESPVSMNFWGFPGALMERFRGAFADFLRKADPEDLTAECLLPVTVDALIRAGELSVQVLRTDAEWFGVTYQEDRPRVQQALLALHAQGIYGERL